MSHRITLSDIQSFKDQKKPITVLTAYDYPFAGILDECGVDIILVGDSLANVVLGLESTRNVGIQEMEYHARAVSRGVKQAFVTGDMPFDSYQVKGADVIADARRLIDAGCDAVKVEWFKDCPGVVEQLRRQDIPVMGHIGLTPQTARESGGFRVRGKIAQDAKALYDQALILQEKGCFAIVLECVPDRVASAIAGALTIPVIGIGAGAGCDGQVLVLHDMIGLYHGKSPKFSRQFCDLRRHVRTAVNSYIDAVGAKSFPQAQETFGIEDEEYALFLQQIKS